MDTLEHMREAVDYIERNLEGEISAQKAAEIAMCSPYHFQRMFAFLVGVPLSEYIRRRRLTLAALDLQNTDTRVLDVAVKYGYTSADAFARAFQGLHGTPPSRAREMGTALKAYPRISFALSLQGVQELNYKLVEKDAFTLLGVTERFSYADDLGASVGGMWQRMAPEVMAQIGALAKGESHFAGAYSEMYPDSTTDYYIGAVSSKPCPEGLRTLRVPAGTWAVFEIVGALPAAMADVWGRIFSEWFPTTGYEHAPGPEIEWYSAGDMSCDDYKSEIWIPVLKK